MTTSFSFGSGSAWSGLRSTKKARLAPQLSDKREMPVENNTSGGKWPVHKDIVICCTACGRNRNKKKMRQYTTAEISNGCKSFVYT